MTIIQSTTLYYRQGNSDKVYQAAIEPKGDGHIVTFAYGRRVHTLKAGTKTPQPVTQEKAAGIYNKLVASKLSKGYTPGPDGSPYAGSPAQERDTGIRCQLLNPVDKSEVPRLLADTRHCLQEKHDGRRMLVRKDGKGTVTGINRRGLEVALPGTIAAAASKLPGLFLIDGEAVGDTLHAFDLLEVKGVDLRQRAYLDRFAGLLRLLDPEGRIRPVSTILDPADKQAMFQTLRQTGAEGMVFKNIDAAFSPSRPASGGTQLKFKFVETASFMVTAHNAKRSVALALLDEGIEVPAGNVTIPPNHAIPQMGTVIEVRYLYAHRQSGSIYQPVYLGERSDIPLEECTVDQLKFKPEALTI